MAKWDNMAEQYYRQVNVLSSMVTAILKVFNPFMTLYYNIVHDAIIYGHYMAEQGEMAEKCYHPVDVLSNPLVLSRFEPR